MKRLQLVPPGASYLPDYVAALTAGWSPDNIRGELAIREALDTIEKNPEAFLASLVDKAARGAPISLPDGSQVKRLPGFTLWLWDGEFCGTINLRWQPGTSSLPPHVLGHIGYAVVPWKRRQGYAREALRQLLPLAKEEGLAYVELTTDLDNLPSQRVIEANHGVVIEHFVKPPAYGGAESLRWRIEL